MGQDGGYIATIGTQSRKDLCVGTQLKTRVTS